MVDNEYFLRRRYPLTCIPSASRASVEVYESLRGKITRIQQSQTDLQTLVDGARKLITEKLIPSPGNTYRHQNKNGPVSLNLDAVMSAMLAFAQDCGGAKGTRYVASAVIACSGKGGDDDDVVHALVSLGVTWLTHFLFVFKTGMHYENHANRNLRESGCPFQSKSSGGTGGSGSPSSYKRVIARDGYRCPVTEFQDLSHPKRTKGVLKVELRKAHILCRLVNNLATDEMLDSASFTIQFSSAQTAFDILAHLTHLQFETLDELNNHIDDPSNSYAPCIRLLLVELKENGGRTPDVYTFIDFSDGCLCRLPKDNLVVLTDHSDDVSATASSTHTGNQTERIALPNPDYLAVHAAIAGILHTSGAGEFFDEVLEGRDGSMDSEDTAVPPVRSWPELERMMEEEALRKAVAEALNSIVVAVKRYPQLESIVGRGELAADSRTAELAERDKYYRLGQALVAVKAPCGYVQEHG
ncbi:hypothetical protein BJ912DRAFT_1042888 [Pholiota molesta]|nr:hypothetical protein BJ912DRAFT_1042888 [Pholiota molesta]